MNLFFANGITQLMKHTDPDQIQRYSNGTSLSELVDLATSVRYILAGLRSDVSDDHQLQKQWELDRLSEVKEKLSKAIEWKRSYYNQNYYGIFWKYCFMFSGQWKHGDADDIVAVEECLLLWDSRRSVMKIPNPRHTHFGKYTAYTAFHEHIQNLNTSQYFNYNPQRLIELDTGEKIDYATLDKI
jgi:hypothetical protein